jgi:hypothetical protein
LSNIRTASTSCAVNRVSSMKGSGGMKTLCRFNWSKNPRIRRVEDRLFAKEESVLT